MAVMLVSERPAHGNTLRVRERDYALGGARPARCRENELLGAACCGNEEYQVIVWGVLTRSGRAAARAGMCSAWHMWHAVSGAFVCW